MLNPKLGKIQRYILDCLKDVGVITFAILTSGMNSKNVYKTLRSFEKNRGRQKLFQAVLSLKRRRLLELKEDGKDIVMKLTRDGKNLTLRYAVNDLQLPRLPQWDKKWRLILFDIPEHHGSARRALSYKLKSIGALQLQRSVFIYPHECRNEIDFITEVFQVSPYVRYVEAVAIEGEKNLKTYFGL